MKHRIQSGSDTILAEIATVDQNIWFAVAVVFLFTAAVFVQKYTTADFICAMSVFISCVFFHEGIIRGTAWCMHARNDLSCIFCIMKWICLDIFVHSAGTFVFFAVIGKENDFFAGVGIIIKHTGIVCD